VLDFGIAKLGEARAHSLDDEPATTIIDDMSAASALETDTLLRSSDDESRTQKIQRESRG
jgi:hypothetical protein